MKKYINQLVALLALIIVTTSCESDAELTVLKSVSFPAAITSSASKIVLTENTADDTAATISWAAVVFPIEAPVLYTVQFDLPANTTGAKAWLNAKAFEAGNDVLSKSFTVRDLNKIATDLGIQPNVEGKLAVRVVAAMDRNIYSDPIEITVTPYEKAVVFGEIYMPGDYQGWAVETASALTAIEKGIYQGYMTAEGTALAFKLNTARTWAEFYGAGATNEDLVRMDDDNLFLPSAGSYQIKVNLNTLKWSATPYAWGIVGTAQSGGWDNSTPMKYDHQTKTWKVTANLVPGALKFRLNNKWDVNYGPADESKNVITKDNAGAYTISEAGTYEVTFTIDETDPNTNGYPATAICSIVKK
ncbi:SusE domain-containing protein [Flavobacterium tistrianum]|uniref:SusE domain-containing protein n=1 Tax=Flavobacterium tistrianum TaxID=1685414 RepID=UPI000DAE2C0D|nr:SusE domain-containing protein [Flavobacterium tistrianum]KAF2339469.1 SusF/SusE family outer membrane protein [Flavobacterium tistrianum]